MGMKRLTALILCLLLSVPVSADAVKLSGLWLEGVTVQGVDEGQLLFSTATGVEREAPLADVEGVKLVNFPMLGEAMDAIEAGQDKAAIKPLADVAKNGQPPWVQMYANRVLVGAADRARNPQRAVRAYLNLLRAGTDKQQMLPEPPVTSVRGASDEVKQKIAQTLSKAGSDPRLEPLIDASAVAPAGAPAAPVPAAPEPAAAKPAAILLPADVGEGPVVDLLVAGEFDRAIDAADRALQQSGSVSKNLYLKGVGHLGKAEQTGDRRDYLDAGLALMRVVIYFPQSRQVGPALVEAGYVHEKIGRPDIARELYDTAAIKLDDEEDPGYYERYTRLNAGLAN